MAAALIGGLTGGAVGAIVGGFVSLVVQRREQSARRSEQAQAERHAFAIAREDRSQQRGSDAYESVVLYAYQMSEFVRRTEPMFTPAPDPPEQITEDELRRLNAITNLHASREVKALVRALSERLTAFEETVFEFRRQRGLEEHGDATIEARQVMQTARKEFDDSLGELLVRASLELQPEEPSS